MLGTTRLDAADSESHVEARVFMWLINYSDKLRFGSPQH